MIIGQDGPAVVVSARTASVLENRFKLAALRARVRGTNTQLEHDLVAIREVAKLYQLAVPPQLPAESEVGSGFAEVEPGCERWMDVAEVADLLGIGDRAVRLACEEERLVAKKVGATWRISEPAAQDYQAARAARRRRT